MTAQQYKTLPGLTWKELLLLLLRRRSRFRITNNSMLPLLKPGEEVLVDPRLDGDRAPQVGDVVVTMHPQRPGFKIIKRVTQVAADSGVEPLGDSPDDVERGDRYFLMGENLSESTDSRSFGWVDARLLQGRVTCRF